MQHKLLIPLIAAGMLSSSPAVLAQAGTGQKSRVRPKKETIVISDRAPETVVEIRNGKIYLNGDLVAGNDGTDSYRKIIIRKEDADDRRLPPLRPGEEDEAPDAGKRAMLGVLTDPGDEGMGALIREVTPGSPAETAGLRAGDRILTLDGRQIGNAADLVNEVGTRHRTGDEVTISYERDGKRRTTGATLAAAPPRRPDPRIQQFDLRERDDDMPRYFFHGWSPMEKGNATSRPKVGVSVEDRHDGKGVTVIDVMPSSAAAMAGLKKGDILTRLDNEPLESVTGLQDKVSRSKPGERLQLIYRRSGREATADLVLPRAINRRDL